MIDAEKLRYYNKSKYTNARGKGMAYEAVIYQMGKEYRSGTCTFGVSATVACQRFIYQSERILGVCIYGCFSEAGEIRWKDIGAIFTGSSTVRSESSIAAGGISVVQAYHRCE